MRAPRIPSSVPSRPAGRAAAAMVALLFTFGVALGAEEAAWVPFSRVMQELSAQPEFVDALIERLGRDPRAGGVLGPENIRRLRELILGKEFEALDRFPAMTVSDMGRSVRLAAEAMKPEPAPAVQAEDAPDLPAEEELGIPVRPSAPPPETSLKDLGFGLQAGDTVDPARLRQYPDAARLAEVLNRLSLNAPGRDALYRVRVGSRVVQSAEELADALGENGHDVEVRDARYFANFGDLVYRGRDVLTPFWMDTGVRIGESKQALLVPVTHSQHEFRVRGKGLDAKLAFFFGIDGKAEFRPMYTQNQSWVLGRSARTYRGRDALEVVRIAADIVREYAAIGKANPGLPFGGYYALGVCNDVNAMIELHMQGSTTLYPLTLDARYFRGDGEVDRLARRLPVDGREGSRPDLARILASLPIDDPERLPIPDLRRDVLAARDALEKGQIGYAGSGAARFWLIVGTIAALVLVWKKPLLVAGVLLAALAIVALVIRRRRAASRRACPASG